VPSHRRTDIPLSNFNASCSSRVLIEVSCQLCRLSRPNMCIRPPSRCQSNRSKAVQKKHAIRPAAVVCCPGTSDVRVQESQLVILFDTVNGTSLNGHAGYKSNFGQSAVLSFFYLRGLVAAAERKSQTVVSALNSWRY